MNYFRKRNETRKKQIDGVESFLSTTLAPVSPSQDFITYLGDRLSNYPQSGFDVGIAKFNWYQYTLLAVLTILGAGVMLAIVIRIVVTWIAWLRLMRQLSKESRSSFFRI